MMRRTLSSRLLGLVLVATAPWAWGQEAAPPEKPAGSILIEAFAFDRGNVKTFVSQYADGGPMVAFGGQSPVVVEYDVEFPVAAEYTLHIRYAAGSSRPVVLSLDGKPVGECCAGVTGSWNTSGARWEETCKLQITQGKHTIKLERPGSFPHVMALRFDSPVAFPRCRLNRRRSSRAESPAVAVTSN